MTHDLIQPINHSRIKNVHLPFLDVDECQRADTCGVGAICTNTLGSYECQCPDGTVPEPDAKTKCITLLRCAVDDDCPGNSVCDPRGKDCSCPEPNIGPDCRRNYPFPSNISSFQ